MKKKPEFLIKRDPESLKLMQDFIKEHVKKRTPEEKLKFEMLSIKFKMEDFVDEHMKHEKHMTIQHFLNLYLKIFKLTLKRFAVLIDTTESKLQKNIDTNFNAELAMKFGSFFHTNSELWLKVKNKNDIISLNKIKNLKKYKKYSYTNLMK